MNTINILLIALGLAADAFAVSVCQGLVVRAEHLRKSLIICLFFGGFQALMPVLGYFLGGTFSGKAESVDHYIAFALLALVGIIMIKESFEKNDNEAPKTLNVKSLFVLAIATSIDAFAVGITFSLTEEKTNIAYAAAIIGVTTFLLSYVGIKIGNIFGKKYKSKAELAGGIILIAVGAKILIEGIIS